MSYNRCVLMGNLGDDPDLKMTAGGRAVMKLSLATSERWKDNNGKAQERTDWHRCVMWGDRAEKLAKHLRKGMRILVEGRIQYGKYEDRDGNTRYSTDIVIDRLTFCERKSAGSSSGSDGDSGSGPSPYGGSYGDDGKSEAKKPADDFDDDDIPF